jgi:hypothetical protein
MVLHISALKVSRVPMREKSVLKNQVQQRQAQLGLTAHVSASEMIRVI